MCMYIYIYICIVYLFRHIEREREKENDGWVGRWMNERMNEWMDIILGHIDVGGSNLKALKDPVGKDHVETVSKTSPKIQRRCRDDQDEDEDAVDDNGNLINLQFAVITIENEPSPNMT